MPVRNEMTMAVPPAPCRACRSAAMVTLALSLAVSAGCGKAMSRRRYQQAQRELERGRLAEALALCDRSIAAWQANTAALETRAALRAAHGRFDGAMADWHGIEDADPALAGRARFRCRVEAFKGLLAGRYRGLADQLQRNGLQRHALVLYDSVLQVAPFDSQALAAIALIRDRQRRERTAAPEQEGALRQRCDLQQDYRLRWGRAYRLNGSPPSPLYDDPVPASGEHDAYGWVAPPPGQAIRIIAAAERSGSLSEFRRTIECGAGPRTAPETETPGARDDDSEQRIDQTLHELYRPPAQESQGERDIRGTMARPASMEQEIRGTLVRPQSMEDDIRNGLR